MAEIWDIARYVEEHPEDYEQRWRLAKKLYTAWEYRLALEHLQVLKNDWERKVNIVRYLAATYYRLGRYDEAIGELEEAIATWPKEIGLHEQLARVLEIAGRREEGARVWDAVAALEPHHPIAANSAKRLREALVDTAESDLRLGDSDSGIDLSPGSICPYCGAQNSEEFDRCWQCHAALAGEDTGRRPTPPLEHRHPALPVLTPEMVSLGVGLVVIGLISVSVYLSLQLLLAGGGHAKSPAVVHTLWELYSRDLRWSRVLTGIGMMVLWPLALWGVLMVAKPERPVPSALVNLTGALLGSLMFVASWLPPNLLTLAPLFPVLLAFPIIVGSFGIGIVRAVHVWAVHLAVVALGTIVLFTAVESYQLGAFFNPLREIPAVARYAREQGKNAKPGEYPAPGTEVPIAQEVVWKPTGSAWLDKRAGDTEFVVYAEGDEEMLKFEVNQGETQPRIYEVVQGRQWSIHYPIVPGETYYVKVHGKAGARARVVVSGLLIPQFR